MREVWRIIDANLNRAREGLRVLEEAVRFLLDDAALTREIKELRHLLAVAPRPELLEARDTGDDVGTALEGRAEGERNSLVQVLAANCKRLQEALRVLEEYGKLVGLNHRVFKEARYRSYQLEKILCERMKNIEHC
ncbi:MAG: hypothetical protein AB1331_02760 [Bacillota bacterium]